MTRVRGGRAFVPNQDDMKYVEDAGNTSSSKKNTVDENAELDLSYLDWWSKYFSSITSSTNSNENRKNSTATQASVNRISPTIKRRLTSVRVRKSTMLPIKEEFENIKGYLNEKILIILIEIEAREVRLHILKELWINRKIRNC